MLFESSDEVGAVRISLEHHPVMQRMGTLRCDIPGCTEQPLSTLMLSNCEELRDCKDKFLLLLCRAHERCADAIVSALIIQRQHYDQISKSEVRKPVSTGQLSAAKK
jgi:hypothetical protein